VAHDPAPALPRSFLNVDLGQRADVCAALKAVKPPVDLVMHFAAVAYVGAWRGGHSLQRAALMGRLPSFTLPIPSARFPLLSPARLPPPCAQGSRCATRCSTTRT
jgi:hypothetical protein